MISKTREGYLSSTIIQTLCGNKRLKFIWLQESWLDLTRTDKYYIFSHTQGEPHELFERVSVVTHSCEATRRRTIKLGGTKET